MSGGPTRSMTFLGRPPEVLSAVQEAARRTGLQTLSGDVSTGNFVFTSGRFLLGLGEKVSVRITQVAPRTVQVTVSSGSRFGVVGRSGRRGTGVDRLSEELSGLLPHAG
jgi:hypothetical protein